MTAAALLLAIQAVAGLNEPQATSDLWQFALPMCGDHGGEIVVCGTVDHSPRFRLLPSDTRFEPTHRRAETTIFGDAKASAEAEHVEIAPGIPSNRIMIRFKVPF